MSRRVVEDHCRHHPRLLDPLHEVLVRDQHAAPRDGDVDHEDVALHVPGYLALGVDHPFEGLRVHGDEGGGHGGHHHQLHLIAVVRTRLLVYEVNIGLPSLTSGGGCDTEQERDHDNTHD